MARAERWREAETSSERLRVEESWRESLMKVASKGMVFEPILREPVMNHTPTSGQRVMDRQGGWG